MLLISYMHLAYGVWYVLRSASCVLCSLSSFQSVEPSALFLPLAFLFHFLTFTIHHSRQHYAIHQNGKCCTSQKYACLLGCLKDTRPPLYLSVFLFFFLFFCARHSTPFPASPFRTCSSVWAPRPTLSFSSLVLRVSHRLHDTIVNVDQPQIPGFHAPSSPFSLFSLLPCPSFLFNSYTPTVCPIFVYFALIPPNAPRTGSINAGWQFPAYISPLSYVLLLSVYQLLALHNQNCALAQ